MLSESIISVKELTTGLRNLLEKEYPHVWVRGELGSIKCHTSGHTYFSLRENDITINCICWRGTPLSIALEEGVEVVCYGKVTVYGGRSSYQLIVREVQATGSSGKLLQMMEELKKKLKDEGLFSIEKKKSLPKFPENIAIITSPTGAVIHDILHRLEARFPCKVILYPVAVQGSKAITDIVQAFELINKNNKIDLIIIARGGGSLEDLWVFNEEKIIREIANTHIPIITAIGHETDTTLSDYASDIRAPTPTAAAEIAVPDKEEIIDKLNILLKKFQNHINYKMQNLEEKIKNQKDMKELAQHRFFANNQKLDHKISMLYQKTNNILMKHNNTLKDIKSPLEKLNKFEAKNIYLFNKINNSYISRINIMQNRLFEIYADIKIYDKKIWIRNKDGKILNSAKEIFDSKNFEITIKNESITAEAKNYNNRSN